MSSVTNLFGGDAVSTTSSSPLLVGPTGGSNNGWNSNGPGPSVYYYVLLGVLLTLIIIAGSLTYRTYRMRRRYRTATQLAIARGDPIPPPTWWGTERTADPFGLGFRRSTRPKKWVRVPTLWDAADSGEGDAKEVDGWIGQPLTVHSALPDTEPLVQPRPSHLHSHPVQNMGVRGRTVGGIRRYWTAEEQRQFDATRERQPSPPAPRKHEVTPGEPVRVAFVVQMPVEHEKEGAASMRTALSEEDETGWRPGMEIGVWEGIVDDRQGQAAQLPLQSQGQGQDRSRPLSESSDVDEPKESDRLQGSHGGWRQLQ